MEEIDTIVLEDNVRYAIITEIEINNIKYVYLTNLNDDKDFCIRKVIEENGQQMLIGLNDKTEFELALLYFAKKQKEEMEE